MAGPKGFVLIGMTCFELLLVTLYFMTEMM